MSTPRLPAAEDLTALLETLHRNSPTLFTAEITQEITATVAEQAQAHAEKARLYALARDQHHRQEVAARRLRSTAAGLAAAAPVSALPFLAQCGDLEAAHRLGAHLTGLHPAFEDYDLDVDAGRLVLSIRVEVHLARGADPAALVAAAHAAAVTFNPGTAQEPAARISLSSEEYAHGAEDYSTAELALTFPDPTVPAGATATLTGEVLSSRLREPLKASGPAPEVAAAYLAALARF